MSNIDKLKILRKELDAKRALWIKWQSKFCYKGKCTEKSSEICQDIQEFITNDMDKSSNQLPYDIHWWFHTIFAILGIFILIIRKHSNWRIIGWIILYIINLTILITFLGIFLSSINSKIFGFIDAIFFHIDLSSSYDKTLVGLIFLIILFMIIASIQLAKKRKYVQFLYINFLSLPIAVGIWFCCLYFIVLSSNLKENTRFFIDFFLVYSCLIPLQKKIFNHILSLPKE